MEGILYHLVLHLPLAPKPARCLSQYTLAPPLRRNIVLTQRNASLSPIERQRLHARATAASRVPNAFATCAELTRLRARGCGV